MFKRLMNIVRGFLGMFISGLEADHPEALIENEKEQLRNQIGKFNENLSNHAGFVEKLNRQIKKLEAQERELTAKIKANYTAGNTKVAGQLASQLQSVKSQLTMQRESYEAAEKQFQSLSKARDVAVQQSQDRIRQLENKISETRMHEAQAELQETAKGMISGIGTSGDSLNRIEALIDEKRDKAAGRSRVAITSGGVDPAGELLLKEAEMDAMNDAALAEFLSMNGMAPSSQIPQSTTTEDDPLAVPQRGMGSME